MLCTFTINTMVIRQIVQGGKQMLKFLYLSGSYILLLVLQLKIHLDTIYVLHKLYFRFLK